MTCPTSGNTWIGSYTWVGTCTTSSSITFGSGGGSSGSATWGPVSIGGAGYTTGTTTNYTTNNTINAYWGGDLVANLHNDGWVNLEYISDEVPTLEASPEEREHYQAVRDWLAAELRWHQTEATIRETERTAQREAAEVRARELLLSVLPEDQKEPYRLTGVFEIIGSHGGRYRIRRGVAGNIDWLHADGRVGGNLCCHAPQWDGDGWIPTPDIMLGQVLALRTDEADFVRVANGPRPPHLAGVI